MSFLKVVYRDEHHLSEHQDEIPTKRNEMIRLCNAYKTSRPILKPLRRYKSKILIQQPSANAKILPPRRSELVLNVSRTVHSQLNTAAGIRKPGVNMCGQHHESFSNVESERDDFEAGRQECNAAPSLFADYTVSPLSFDRSNDSESCVCVTDDQMKLDPVITIDDDVYEELDDMKVFVNQPFHASPSEVTTANIPDVIIIDDSADDDDNPLGCISLPPRQPHKKRRLTRYYDLPIHIGERIIPSYEEYVPKESGTSRSFVEQPLNRPFRYS